MPQSLIKTPPAAGQALQVHGRPLTAAHEQIVSILRNRLGQNHGDLLAVPKAEADGGIAWSTALTGTVQPVAQLPEDDARKLRQRAERILAEINGLAQQMRAEGPASQVVAQMLERAAQTPPGDWLYSVGGKPVLAMWGHAPAGAALPVEAPVAAAAAMPSAASAAATPAAAAATGAPPSPPPPIAPAAATAASPWKRWLLWGLLALLLLALLGWGLTRCSTTPQADAGLDVKVAEAEARNKALEDELASKQGQAPQMQCVPDPVPPPASAPEPEPPAAPASVPEPEPAASKPVASPMDQLKDRIGNAGQNCDTLAAMLKNEPLLKGSGAQASALKAQIARTMAANCREKLIKEAKNLCPGQRPKEVAPEMAIVFDASGSMNFSLDVTDAQIRQAGPAAQIDGLMRQFGLGGGGGVLDRLTREPKRITVAKRAALALAQRLPSDMNAGLVLIEQCPSARSAGFYAPGQRGSLIGQIQGIQPKGGTPLADGIAKGGAMLDGVTKESLMVVISDGTESCGGDPCAAAAALKRAKPLLKINVVDITGTGAGNCVARLTGGKVFTANNANEVVDMVNRASQEAMGPANCRP